MPLYEYEEGKSRKFYRIELDGTRVRLQWGRIGTDGERQELTFATEREARAEYDRQRAKRTQQRGYTLVVDEGAPRGAEQAAFERLAQTGTLTEHPRYLFVHRKSRRFAWIEIRGDELVHAAGAIGDEASAAPTTKRCGSRPAAERERDTLVGRLLGLGYELEAFGRREQPTRARGVKHVLRENRALEDVVAEDPDDEARWQVLEDWLLEQGDPRGELVQLEKANRRGDEATARGALLPALLGPKHEGVARRLGHQVWRAGFLRGCELAPSGTASELVEAFFAAPATALLSDLELRPKRSAMIPIAIEALLAARCARTLRRLVLRAETGSGRGIALDGSRLAPLTALRELDVHGDYCALAHLAAPRMLHALRYVVPSERDLFEVLDGFVLPELRTLHLDLARLDVGSRYVARIDRDRLHARLATVSAPLLAAIRIEHTDGDRARAILDAFRDTPLLRQLRTLELGWTEVPRGALAGFEHLDRLTVPWNVSP